jgi:4-hydroxy-3-polyprenylbenzoate decarboxylase
MTNSFSNDSALSAPFPRLIVGISGASGVIYGIRMLEMLKEIPLETHLIMSRAAETTVAYETGRKIAEIHALADVVHPVTDIAAAPSSGSFKTMGMVIAPCSMRSLAEIAGGATTSLLTRAADVVLKERRRLVLMTRETPLHSGHLRNMLTLSDMGAIVAPPVPAFYIKPETVDELVDQTVGRVLDLFGVEAPAVRRWGEDSPDDRPTLRGPRRNRKL